MHIVGREPWPTERAVAQLVVDDPGLQQLYGGWMASLHAAAWREAETMARSAEKGLKIDLRPAIEMLGLGTVIDQVGVERVIEQIGKKELVKRIGLDDILANLSPAERRELKRRLQ